MINAMLPYGAETFQRYDDHIKELAQQEQNTQSWM